MCYLVSEPRESTHGRESIMAKIKKRNWIAVHAHNRKAGAMPDKKKQKNKKACRGQVKGGE